VVAELLGWFAAGLSCAISLPQVVRAMRAKQLDGISSATYGSFWPTLRHGPPGRYLLANTPRESPPSSTARLRILHRLAGARHDTPDPGVHQ
jgi:hypothetical protein